MKDLSIGELFGSSSIGTKHPIDIITVIIYYQNLILYTVFLILRFFKQNVFLLAFSSTSNLDFEIYSPEKQKKGFGSQDLSEDMHSAVCAHEVHDRYSLASPSKI